MKFGKKIITFVLAFIMLCAVCCGLMIAIIAGVAYGYNYSLAEWLTFTRYDTAVYKRGGEHTEFPVDENVLFPRRRSVDGHDMFPSKGSTEYPDTYVSSNVQSNVVSISDKPEKLPTHSNVDEGPSDKLNYFKHITPSNRDTTVTILRGLSTANWQSAASDIIMRKFKPLDESPVFENANIKEYSNFDKSEKIFSKKNVPSLIEKVESIQRKKADNKVRVLGGPISTKRFMRPVTVYKATKALDYSTEDVDEDNVVYKPV